MHLHTAFETVEQTLVLNESKDRMSSNALNINRQKNVWAVSIEVLKNQMVGGRGSRLLHKLSEEVFAAILRFREVVLSSFVAQQSARTAVEFDQSELLKVKNTTKMLADLGMYSDAFESSFLDQTGEFFAARSKAQIDAGLPLPQYLAFAAGIIQIEGKLAHFYLQAGTFLKLVELLEARLIADHQSKILQGLPSLLDDGWLQNERAVQTLFEFFDQTGLIPELLKAWKKFIEDNGNQAFAKVRQETSQERLVTAIRQICDLKEKTNLITSKCFSNNQAVLAAQKNAFEVFLNVEGRQDRSAQLLALMIDQNMRKRTTKDESTAISLYRMLHATDTFDKMYSFLLAKRLIEMDTCNFDHEV